MLPAILLIGLAFGLGFSSLTVAATAGVPDAEQGLAASLFQTSFQVGGAVVLAIVTAVVDASGAGGLVSPAATLAAYRPALILITAVAAVGALVALSGLRRQQDGAVPVGELPVRSGDLAERSAVPVAVPVSVPSAPVPSAPVPSAPVPGPSAAPGPFAAPRRSAELADCAATAGGAGMVPGREAVRDGTTA
jgi:hypothetical protein